MSTVKTNNVQVGQSLTATNNFTLYQPATPDGTVRLGVGNTGATTADVITATSAGNVGIGTSSPVYRLQVGGQTGLTGAAIDLFRTGGLSSNIGGVLNFRPGLGQTASDIFNLSICAYDHSGDANADGLSINASDGISFCTGSNSRQERARIDSSGNMMWNGTNTTTQNGNVGYVYKFFGGANNAIIPLESTGTNRYGVLEYRRTGRSSPRAAQIGIGENAGSQGEVQVYGSAANADISGGVVLANGATSWSAISDMRLKTVTGTYTNALQDIAQIQAIKFTWKHDQNGTPQVGVSAQSVELVVPEAISTSKNIATPDDETEYLAVRYTELIPLLIASIQELNAKVTALEERLASTGQTGQNPV
jgi:hypothetical protein